MKKLVAKIALVVPSIIGCGLAIAAFVPAAKGSEWANAASACATALSILLAVVSILYTYQTNQKTEELLSSIERQSIGMMDRINSELRKDNFGRQNIEYLENKFTNEKNKDDAG